MSHPTLPRLGMPLFVNPADVILRMQLSTELTGTEDVVASGIQGAQLHVERILGSKIGRQSHDSYFYIDSDMFSGIQPGGMYRLELPSGFIRTDSALAVATTPPGVVGNYSSTSFGVYTPADVGSMRVDHRRGYILLDATVHGNNYVHVTGETGYEDGTRLLPPTTEAAYDNAVTYQVGALVQLGGIVYRCIQTSLGVPPPNTTKWAYATVPVEQIPDALYEAIISLVPMVFNANQATNRSQEAKDQYRTMTDHAELLLQDYVRTKGFSFRPL